MTNRVAISDLFEVSFPEIDIPPPVQSTPVIPLITHTRQNFRTLTSGPPIIIPSITTQARFVHTTSRRDDDDETREEDETSEWDDADETTEIGSLRITLHKNGRRTVSSKPRIEEGTCSGGGGKGTAYLGVMKVLIASGVLNQMNVLNGASAGAITASVLASGLSIEEIEATADKVPDALLKDRSMLGVLGSRMMGQPGIDTADLAATLKASFAKAVTRHIEDLKRGDKFAQLPASYRPGYGGPTSEEIEAILKRLNDGGETTFGDLKTLHKIVPQIKELSVTVTSMATQVGDDAPGKHAARLLKISAETFPDAPISKAVCGSAAFPQVIQRVQVPLGTDPEGRPIVAECQDGGVMNNTPASVTFGVNDKRNGKRQLRRAPGSGITMVFADQSAEPSEEELERSLQAKGSGFADMMTDAPNALQKYLVNRALQRRKNEIAKIKLPQPYASIVGTLSFRQSPETQLKLRTAGEKSMSDHLGGALQDVTREFGSESEMLYGFDEADLLELIAAGGENGRKAEEALRIRKGIEATVANLAALLKAGDPSELGRAYRQYLKLEKLCGDDPGRSEFVAIELNSYEELDVAVASLREMSRGRKKAPPSPLTERTLDWSSRIDARQNAEYILERMIGPALVYEEMQEVTRMVMEIVASKLSRVETRDDLDGPLLMLQKHFQSSLPIGFLTELRLSDGPVMIVNEERNKAFLKALADAPNRSNTSE